ncbi:MAG: putative quinol monooxygenase [Actinomycetota bacterium]
MSKVSLLAKLPIKEGSKDAFLAAFADMATAVEAEAGTEIYILNWANDDDHMAYIFELYTDADAMAVHSGSDAMKALMGALGDILGGAPELIMLTPDSGKGL